MPLACSKHPQKVIRLYFSPLALHCLVFFRFFEKMRIAIEGCTHGELEKTYQTIKQIEERDGQKVDLLLCCGDFQSTRKSCVHRIKF